MPRAERPEAIPASSNRKDPIGSEYGNASVPQGVGQGRRVQNDDDPGPEYLGERHPVEPHPKGRRRGDNGSGGYRFETRYRLGPTAVGHGAPRR